MNRKQLISIFLVAFVVSILSNEINLQHIARINPENEKINSKSLVFDNSIWSIDNSWYLPQAYNLLQGKGLSLDPQNPYMSVRRTPGYPLFFYAHLKILGEVNAYKLIRFTQVLFFSISALLLSMAVFNLTGNRTIALITGLMYSLSFYHVGWLYYTITEAIHPEMLIVVIYFFSKFIRTKQSRWLLACGLSLGIVVLIRPFDGLILPFIVLYILMSGSVKKYQQILAHFFIFIAGFTLVLLPWTIRNFLVTNGEVVPLEKYYQDDPMNMGKGHVAFRKWWSSWGISDSEREFTNIVTHTGNDSLIQVWTRKFVAKLPNIAFRGYGEKEVSEALSSLMLCHREKIESGRGFQLSHPDKAVLACDEVATVKFENLINRYKYSDPIRYWIITPFTFTKELVFQSNSSAIAMLNPEDRKFNIWQKLIKGWMYIFNVFLYSSIIILPFIKLDNNIILWLVIGFPLVSIVFLTVFFRHIEGRYMLQTYFCMMISLAAVIHYFIPLTILENLVFKLRKGLSNR